MFTEFGRYLDFWVKGQKQGYAGETPEIIKLPDGSKYVSLYEHPLLHFDRWYGSDLGGGQTILYVLSEPWDSENPLCIVGTPVARLGYSGEITTRFSSSGLEILNAKKTFKGVSSVSDIVWKVLKSALSQVSRERPLRGPEFYRYPECGDFVYTSKERRSIGRIIGEEKVTFEGYGLINLFQGNYDCTLIKKNLGDSLLKI